MADGHWLYRVCPRCNGVGQYEKVGGGDPPSLGLVDCELCNTTGVVLWGYMTKDDYPLPDGIPDPPA